MEYREVVCRNCGHGMRIPEGASAQGVEQSSLRKFRRFHLQQGYLQESIP